MPRTQLFARLRGAMVRARQSLPDAPPPTPRAISRRSALALMAAAAACSPRALQRQDGAAPDPVAIIGAGTSGLVVAWRLANAGLPVEIFESNGRTGGRMYTLRDFTPEGHFCELGGELVDSNHAALIDLCGELGLPIQRLRPETDPATDVFDFGGRQYTVADLLDHEAKAGAFVPVARRIAVDQAALLDAEGNWTPRALELDAMPLSQYLASLEGVAERWVLDLLALAYHCEYGIPLDQQSALNLVDFIGVDPAEPFEMFGDSDEAHRIAGGSSTLPETLTQRLSAPPLSQRVTINLRHELAGIANGADAIRLIFRTQDGATAEKTFRRAVLTLPFTRLREVKGVDALGLSPEKLKAINELGYGVNSKLMVATSARPWTGSLFGLNTPLSGSIYSDRGFQIVWDTSAGQEGAGGVLTNFLTGDPARSEEAAALATLQKGLETLSPELAKSLTPNLRASFFWPMHPHTKASYAGCLVGQYTGMLEAAARPELDGRLVFAGEHTSIEFPGFMNGAVDAGERAAKDILGSA